MVDRVRHVLNTNVMVGRRRQLRQKTTKFEGILWSRIRNNQLGCRFKRQYSVRNFVVDFYCHKARLAIEIDGPIHLKRQKYDKFRTEYLAALGIEELRFTNEQVIKNSREVIFNIKNRIPSLEVRRGTGG